MEFPSILESLEHGVADPNDIGEHRSEQFDGLDRTIEPSSQQFNLAFCFCGHGPAPAR